MSNPSAQYVPLGYPTGQAYAGGNQGSMDQTYNHIRLEGTVTVSPGTTGAYQATGVPISFTSAMAGYNPNPFVGWLESVTQGWEYKFDPVNQSMHIFEGSQFPGGFPPAVIAGDFTASANWGTSPTLAPTATSNQQAFSLSITAQNTTGANPTMTVAFPQPFPQAPTFVCCRGDALSDAGYFVFTSSTRSQAVFTFVGTPTATHVYVLEAYGISSNLSQPAVASSAFAISTGWGATSALTVLGTSTQNAFEVQIAGSGGTYGANPTIILTFPVPYATAPQFVCCRADTVSNAGYLVFTGSTTTTATFTFIGTAAGVTYKFCALLLQSKAASLAASNFAASANFGATPVISVTGTQGAFTASVTTPSSGTGANPTLTLTFPVTLSVAPNAVVCRGDSLSTAGYWVVTSTSTTGLVLTYIGTPAASSTFIADVLVQLYAPGTEELPIGAIVPPGVLADTIYIEAITSRT